MEILAGLICLESQNELPVPWFNRPALGLSTHTSVRIGVAQTSPLDVAPPDILVTPLRTDRLHHTASVTVDLKERTGAFYDVLREVGKRFNIALTETVTIDQRTIHRVTLLLEPPSVDYGDIQSEIARTKGLIDELTERLAKLDGHVQSEYFLVADERTKFEKEETRTVEHGRITAPDIRRWMEKRYIPRFKDTYDFSRIVVSSSANHRYIRYIIPKKGVFQATVSHLDTPGALAEICGVFEGLGFNILLSRTSRSDGTALRAPEKSIFVAVCEPPVVPKAIDSEYAERLASSISQRIERCDPRYQLDLQSDRVSLGRTTSKMAYPNVTKQVSVKEISAQAEIVSHFSEYNLTSGRGGVFMSYQNHLRSTQTGLALLEAGFRGVRNQGSIVYDGFKEPHPLRGGAASDARARLWLANAAVFFAVGIEGKTEMRPNQLIEWGYIYGQNKPFAVVVKAGDEGQTKPFMTPDSSFITFTNLNDPNELATISREIEERVRGWFLL